MDFISTSLILHYDFRHPYCSRKTCTICFTSLYLFIYFFALSGLHFSLLFFFRENPNLLVSPSKNSPPPPLLFWFHIQIYDSFPPPIRRAPGLKPSILSYNCLFTRLNSYFFVDKEYFTFLTKNKLSFDSKE